MATMRITTGMAMNTYRYNLQNSTYNLTDARNKVLSHRNFDTFAEDPTAAAQAWKIRRAMVDNSNYQSNNSNTYSRFNFGWATMGMIKTDLETEADVSDIRARQDATAGARVDLGKILNDTAESVIQAMNSAKFGDHFVFSGDDEMNAPFSWSADGKTLYYRGVDVNSGGVKKPTDEPDWGEIDIGTGLPQKMPYTGRNAVEQAWVDYYKNQKEWAAYEEYQQAQADYEANQQAWADYEANQQAWADHRENGAPEPAEELAEPSVKLEQPAKVEEPATPKLNKPSEEYATDPFAAESTNEFGVPGTAYAKLNSADPAERLWATYYVDQGDKKRLDALAAEYENIDLGMGLQEDENGKLINGTAFNRSLPGINMLGYGRDEDGDPVNISLIMKRLGEIYSACDPTTGKFSEDPVEDAALTREADRLLDKYQAATDRTNASYVDVETKAHYLNQNQARLKLQGDYLQEERENIENVDLADAITQLNWVMASARSTFSMFSRSSWR